MVGLLVTIFMAAFYLCGCEKVEENNYIVEGGYPTIDGEYRVEITELEDTCYGDLSDPWWDKLEVFVQERYEDGGYLASLFLSDELWLPDVEVEDGVVDYEYIDEFYGERFLMNGIITPEIVELELLIQGLDWYGEIVCYIQYQISGYKLYVNAPPPDSYER